MVNNIRWFYSADFAPSLFANGFNFEEITSLTNQTSESTLTFSSDRLRLTIGNIVQAITEGEETDAGRYFLEATNEAGVGSTYIDLIVFGKYCRCFECEIANLNIFYLADGPVIATPPSDQFTISDGSSATFFCDALAFPEHTISWTFTNISGVVTDIVSDDSKYSIVANHSTTRFGELTVMNVDYEDRGVYTCTATNSIGSDRASANLSVHGEG